MLLKKAQASLLHITFTCLLNYRFIQMARAVNSHEYWKELPFTYVSTHDPASATGKADVKKIEAFINLEEHDRMSR